MLTPVADHEADAEERYRENEDKDGGTRAGMGIQRVDGEVVA